MTRTPSNPPVTFLSPEGSEVLALCRRLRHVDTAVVAARQELREVGDLVDRVNPLVAIPETMLVRLSAVSFRLRDLEQQRGTVATRLESLVGTLDETVPDRVL